MKNSIQSMTAICQQYSLGHSLTYRHILEKFEESYCMGDTSWDFWHMLDKLVAENKLIIDRPKGSNHPRYNNFVYPLDYGYLEGTSSQDGDGIDVWIGSSQNKQVVGIISSVDYIKKDSDS